MEQRTTKIMSQKNRKVLMRVIPGHFATNHSHINYYMDMTALRCRQSEASEIARTMVNDYMYSTIIDTIVCMDGCEVIGSYLAEELTQAGIMSMNKHQSMYVVTPEVNSTSQLIFRDNLDPMIRDKNILLLLATATTGKTIARSIECIEYYGGKIQGISAIFSATEQIGNHKVNAVFTADDLPNYQTYNSNDCPLCKQKTPLDAIVNGFGYSKI